MKIDYSNVKTLMPPCKEEEKTIFWKKGRVCLAFHAEIM